MNRYILMKKEVPYDLSKRTRWQFTTQQTINEKEKMSVFGVKDTHKGIEYSMYLVTDLPLGLMRKKLIPIIVTRTEQIDDYIVSKMIGHKGNRDKLVTELRSGIAKKEYMNKDRPY